MNLRMLGMAGIALVFLFLYYVVMHVYAGIAGLAHHLGWGGAAAMLLVALVFRFPLPLTIGAFLGARDVWGWHWLAAFVFAAPGLLAMLPGLLRARVSMLRARMARAADPPAAEASFVRDTVIEAEIIEERDMFEGDK